MDKSVKDNEYDPSLKADQNVARGLFAIAKSLGDVAYQLKCLGTGDAPTGMGAMEFLAVQLNEGLRKIAS